MAHGQAITNCTVENVGNTAGREDCQREATRVFEERLREIDALDQFATEAQERCITECGRKKEECETSNANASTGAVSANIYVGATVTITCVEGGAPCFQPVSRFCSQISGACDQCLQSLCGGGEWTVETVGDQLPLNTTLVAATDPSKSPRVLATSTTRGNQAVLNVPRDIKLGGGEQLYFGFSPAKRGGGPIQVRIQRSK
jgi:hypothetical protein